MSQTHLKTDVATTLLWSPQYSRLTAALQDLIIINYERSTNRRGSSLRLTKLDYVSGENSGGKYYMLYAAQVKDLALDENVTIQVQFTVSNGVFE